MLRAPGTPRVRYSLRATAITAAITASITATALVALSVAGTAYAAPTARFGSPYPARSHGSFGAPATGVVYNGTQAVTQLQAIASATRTASAGGALVTGTEFSDGYTNHLTLTVDGTRATRVQLTGSDGVLVFQSPTEQYVSLDRTDPDVRAALQLLGNPNVHYAAYASTTPMINPADMLELLYGDYALPIASMKRTEHAGLIQYQIAVNVPASQRGELPDSASVTTDRSGRLVAFSMATTNSVNGEQYAVRYGPQSVVLPAPPDVVDGTQFDRATTSIHLPQALAYVAELGYFSGQPTSGPETLAQFRAAVRTEAVDPDNGMAGIAVTVADVTNGVTLTARNPFTNANVTVRAVLDGGGWISVTDSAGRPVDPDGGAVGIVALRMGQAAASKLGVRHSPALTLPFAGH